jgi:hypothetical protein
MSIRKRTPFLIILCGLLLSCGREAENKFNELCEKESRSEIYKTVVAEGFYDSSTRACASCWFPIIESGYSYIEVCLDEATSYRYELGKGCWKFYKAELGSPLCKEDVTKFSEQDIKRRGGSYCIAAEKIDTPQSSYESLFKEKVIFSSKDKNEEISEQYWELRDNKNKIVLGTQKDFQIFEKNHIEGGFGNKPCRKDGKAVTRNKFYQYGIRANTKD